MILRDLVGTSIWLASRAAWNVMECYRCAANQVLTYLILNFRLLHWVVFLGQKTNCVTIASKSKCRLLRSIIKCREGRSMKNFSLFIARDSISFCSSIASFACSPPLPFESTCTLNQGSSVHFSRNRKWKVFHSERGFRSDTSLLLDSNVQNTMFEKKLR